MKEPAQAIVRLAAAVLTVAWMLHEAWALLSPVIVPLGITFAVLVLVVVVLRRI